MVAITALKPDDIVYDLVTQRMGNTMLTRRVAYSVRIVEVADDRSYVMASWNSNAPRKYGASQVSKWRRTKPAT